jgi:hypothetical protein
MRKLAIYEEKVRVTQKRSLFHEIFWYGLFEFKAIDMYTLNPINIDFLDFIKAS